MSSKRRVRHLPRVVACLVSIGVVWACYAPTELVTAISTDVDCTAVRINGVSIKTAQRSGDLASTQVATESIVCTERSGSNDLGTLVLIPNGDAEDVVIEVVLGVDRRTSECQPPSRVDGCIVARRHVSFVRHRSLRVPIALSRSCVGVQCGEDQTCDRSVCVSAEAVSCPNGECRIDVETEGGVSLDPPSSDAGPIRDGALVDAPFTTVDSGIDNCPVRPRPFECNPCASQGKECCITMMGVICTAIGTCESQGATVDKACTQPCHCPAGVQCGTFGGCPHRVCGGCFAER